MATRISYTLLTWRHFFPSLLSLGYRILCWREEISFLVDGHQTIVHTAGLRTCLSYLMVTRLSYTLLVGGLHFPGWWPPSYRTHCLREDITFITGTKYIIDKYYDETKMRTRQIQRFVIDTWRYLGCRTKPLEHCCKRQPTVKPRWALLTRPLKNKYALLHDFYAKICRIAVKCSVRLLSKMRTRQIQRFVIDTWRYLGCRTKPLEHCCKRQPTVICVIAWLLR